jgi:hypothetical protein
MFFRIKYKLTSLLFKDSISKLSLISHLTFCIFNKLIYIEINPNIIDGYLSKKMDVIYCWELN